MPKLKPLPAAVRESYAMTVAHMCLRRDARHVPVVWNTGAAVLAVVVPEGMGYAVSALLKAVYDVASFKRSSQVSWYVDPADRKDFASDCAVYRRVVVVTERDALLPEDIHVQADAVVHLGRPETQHWQAAALKLYGMRLTDGDVALLDGLPYRFVNDSFRPGRPLGRCLALARHAQDTQRWADDGKTKAAPAAKPSVPPGPTIDDLHGLGEAGVWARDLVQDLEDWVDGRISWSDVDRGVLLSGPPGTGKTTFAAALARTCGAYFVSGSYARWQAAGHMGQQIAAMRKSFAEAKQHAPAILFIDEIDGFGSRSTSPGGDFNDYSDKVITALLEELDGVEGREGVVVVGACNHPQRLDPAIVRPGRLDRHIVIPLPDGEAREGILRHHLKGALDDVDLCEVVELTDGWTGAALEQLVRTGKRSARRARRPMSIRDLAAGLPELVSVPDDQVYRMAVHEAGHAVVGHALGSAVVAVGVVRTAPRQSEAADAKVRAGGYTQFATEVVHVATRSYMHSMILRVLAAQAAETVILGEPSSGSGGNPGSDLHFATLHAAAMEGALGMGEHVSMITEVAPDRVMEMVRHDYDLRARVERRLRAAMDETKDLVARHRSDIETVALALVAEGHMDGERFREIVGGQPRLRLVEV